MSDQCKNCTVRGDYEACIATPCSKHESWIDTTRIERIKELKKQVKAMGWRSISEAPKSGTPVDLWNSSSEKRLTDCRWDGNNRWVRWEENTFGVMAWCVVKGRISHFMPLPQPPVKK